MIHARGDDCISAWKAAAGLLLDSTGCEGQNLIVEIEHPTTSDPEWFTRFDPRRIDPKAKSVRDVANTIFPRKTFENARKRKMDFFKRYGRAFSLGKKRIPTQWGTYFERLTAFRGAKVPVNQLARAITVLKTWGKNSRAALVFHLSASHLDRPRPIGGPCLQYAQIVSNDGKLDLVVLYRSQDYFYKALGNFIGLGELLNFLATESGRTPGRLICHSVHAFAGTKTTLRRLVEEN